jgi:hypothetical protein
MLGVREAARKGFILSDNAKILIMGWNYGTQQDQTATAMVWQAGTPRGRMTVFVDDNRNITLHFYGRRQGAGGRDI